MVKLQDSGLSEVALALGYNFVTYDENLFATPGPALGVGTRANPQKPPFHLTWASLNVRSIYGREKTLTDVMCKHRISVLALQETFERSNDPPSGLFASVYSKPSDDGRRGVMLIVHPLLEKAAQWEPGLGGTNPNILWIKVEMGGLDYFVASVYMPDNSKYKEADEVARQLFADLDIIPGRALTVIMGDWNFDPFEDKGRNKSAFRKMLTHPRLELMRRIEPTDWTRPASRSHIDNIFVSKNLIPKTTSPPFYLQIPAHSRAPSDHILVGFKSTSAGKRGRMRTVATQYDNAPLKDCKDHDYTRVLDGLSERWSLWVNALGAAPGVSFGSNRKEVELISEGLKMIVYSASFQTLPTKRVKVRSVNAGAMQTIFASGKSRSELWDIVAQRLKRKARARLAVPSLQVMEGKLREQGARTPSSGCTATKKWVRRCSAKLDLAPTTEESRTLSYEQLVEVNLQVLLIEVRNLRWRTAGGLDNISAAQIKRAPVSFLRALATFAARCAWLKCFPRWYRLARAKFIPKPEAGKYRGLRLEDLLTKLVEKCILHPFFPSFGPEPGLIAPEHFADRRGISAEMVAGILAIIIDAHKGSPLYLLVADAKEAYDNVWRDALWAKLAEAHKCTEEVRSARALYEHMDAQIVEEDFLSDTVKLGQGFPQGGPRSGKLFAFFNSDLPEDLRSAGAGISVGDVDITCATYLDDSMVPTHSEGVVRDVLGTLEAYGDRWSQQWSTTKFIVLCVNVTNPPAQWLFKDQWIDSVRHCRYLGVHFEPGKGWGRHLAMKRTAAIIARLELRRAGLLGGKNAPADSLEVARAILWAIIDYGRGVASSQGSRCKTIAKTLDSFHTETLREILGVSSHSVKAGVRGETGEIPDKWRERKRQLLLARQMLTSPRGGLLEKIASQANRSIPKLGIFRVVCNFLEEARGPRLEDFRSRGEIKRWITAMATQEWKTRVEESDRLARTYRLCKTLTIHGYLKRVYPGRQILTRLRIDDLDLGAASYRGMRDQKDPCTLCGVEAETREHFALRCQALQTARIGNKQAMDLIEHSQQDSALDILILAVPQGASDDIPKAMLVGMLLHDLWTLRSKVLGIRQTLD